MANGTVIAAAQNELPARMGAGNAYGGGGRIGAGLEEKRLLRTRHQLNESLSKRISIIFRLMLLISRTCVAFICHPSLIVRQ